MGNLCKYNNNKSDCGDCADTDISDPLHIGSGMETDSTSFTNTLKSLDDIISKWSPFSRGHCDLQIWLPCTSQSKITLSHSLLDHVYLFTPTQTLTKHLKETFIQVYIPAQSKSLNILTLFSTFFYIWLCPLACSVAWPLHISWPQLTCSLLISPLIPWPDKYVGNPAFWKIILLQCSLYSSKKKKERWNSRWSLHFWASLRARC